MTNDQPPLPDEDSKPFEPVWRPRREREVVGSVWTNAAIGFVAAVVTGFVMVPLVMGLPPRFMASVAVTVLIGLIVLLTVISLKTGRTGLVGGALLAIGVCMLCPFVGLFMLCGGMRFN